jgi:hypothetical protein
MKKFMKVSVMAFVAMFAINTVADAQTKKPVAKAKAVVKAGAKAGAAAVQEVEMTSYTGDLFSFEYPADWKSTDNTIMDVAFRAKDGVTMVEASSEWSAFDANDLKDWAAQKKEKKAIWSMKGGDVVTKGDISTIRFTGVQETYGSMGLVKNNIVTISFAVNSNGKTVTGDITYLQKDEAKMKPVVEKILASLKAKSGE